MEKIWLAFIQLSDVNIVMENTAQNFLWAYWKNWTWTELWTFEKNQTHLDKNV